MKKIVFALATLAIVSCKKEEVKPVDYTLFTGKVTNQKSDKLTIVKGRDVLKEISVDENGVFSDTLRIAEGSYVIHDGNESASIYIKKGLHFNMTLDTKEFDETLKFTGTGAEQNNYFADLTMLQETVDLKALALLDKTNFDKELITIKKSFTDLLANVKGLDSITSAIQSKNIEALPKQLTQAYNIEKMKQEMVGKPSPTFENYENHAGGTTSLADLKGKFVYIDMWATWCGPCKREIPFLKEVEKEFHGKNIEFVSISVDRKNAHETWVNMIKEKEMTGVQLFADNNFQSKFAVDYGVNSIPRFILLDPNGNIVSADAPRPSSPELKTLLTEQGI